MAITGGAGFIGSALAAVLVAEGDEVVVVDNLSPQVHLVPPAPVDGVRLVEADVRDEAAMATALKDVELIFHLAAETGVGQSQYEIARYVDTNTTGTAVVLEAAARGGAQRVVVTSSRAVYGEGEWQCPSCGLRFGAVGRAAADLDVGIWDLRCPACATLGAAQAMTEDTPWRPCSVYGVTKVQQEQLAGVVNEVSGTPVTVLRPFNVYGPGQSLSNPYTGVLGVFFRLAAGGEPIELYEDGMPMRDFVFVGDVVEALRRAGQDRSSKSEVFNVGFGRAASLRQVAEAVFAALDQPPRIEVSGRYRVGDVRHTIASIDRLRDGLGCHPSTDLATGVDAFVKWAIEQGPVMADDRGAAASLAERSLLRASRPEA